MKPALVLVHGWGFDPSIWEGIAAEEMLRSRDLLVIDLGFREASGRWPARDEGLPADRPLVGVGHSLGFAWLLAQERAWDGLVSINGFPRFTSAPDFPQGVHPRVLARMQAKLARDVEGVTTDFLRRCGLEIHGAAAALPGDAPSGDGTLIPSSPGIRAGGGRLVGESLAEGLEWLASWDWREKLGSYGGPLLALAGRDDPIVSAEASEAAFPAEALRWQEDGGHLLPLTHAASCAEALARFLAEEVDR